MGRRQKDSAHPPNVRPLDVDGVRTVAIVTVGWGAAFVALALSQGQLNDAGNGWWLWTCLAGVGLGLLGLEYCRKRRDAIARAALDAEAEAGEFDDDGAVGDWSRLPPEEDLDSAADEQPRPDEQSQPEEQPQRHEPPVPASADHVTRPYQHRERTPGHTNGETPAVNRRPGSSDYGYGPQPQPSSAEPPTPQPAPRDHEPEPQRPADRPQPQPAPLAAPAQQASSSPTEPVHSRRAAQRPGSRQQPDQAPAQQAPQQPQRRQQQPNQPVRQQPPQPLPSPPQAPQSPSGPPRAPQSPSGPPRAAPPPPPRQPEPEPADPYSTGAGWYDSAAGYTPDADRSRRHPRDRRAEPPQPSGPPADPPAAGSERPGRRSLEDSEFFGSGSSTPPPNSTAEFLLADLQGDAEQQPPARHDRDAPSEEYRGRRARGSR